MPDKMPREGYIVNPKTGRYIKIDGPTAKKLFKSGEIPRPAKDCPPGKVHNPKTGRCIDINGTLAKKLGLNKKPEAGAGAGAAPPPQPPPQAEPKPEKPKKEPKAPKPPKEPKAPKPPKEPKPVVNSFYMPKYDQMAKNQIYEVLGITSLTSDEETVKNAYRTLIRKYHPDKQANSEEAKNITQEITTAYNILKNKDFKYYYDANKNYYSYGTIINTINRIDQQKNKDN